MSDNFQPVFFFNLYVLCSGSRTMMTEMVLCPFASFVVAIHTWFAGFLTGHDFKKAVTLYTTVWGYAAG